MGDRVTIEKGSHVRIRADHGGKTPTGQRFAGKIGRVIDTIGHTGYGVGMALVEIRYKRRGRAGTFTRADWFALSSLEEYAEEPDTVPPGIDMPQS